MSGLTLRVVDDEAAFAALGPEWDELVASTECATPFMSHGRLAAWWRAYGDGSTLQVLAYRDEATGGLVGALPLYRERPRGPLRTRRLRFIGETAAANLAPIVRKAASAAVLERMAADLASGAVEWDALDLLVVADDAPVIGALSAALGARRCAIESGKHVCPRAALPRGWEPYLSTLSKRMRHEVRHGRKEVRALGIDLETITAASDLPGALDDMLALYEGRLQVKIGPSFEVRDSYRTFVRDFSRTLLAEGSLRLAFLVKDGRRIAFVYQFRCGDTMYLTHQAFDPEWGQARVSAILLSYAIEAAIDEGCAMYDMLLGADRYKYSWGVTQEARFSDVHAYAATPRGQAQHGLDGATRLAARVARSTPAPVRDRLATWVRAVRRSRLP